MSLENDFPAALPPGAEPVSRRVAFCTAMFLFAPAAAYACPVCFGASDGPMLQGSNMGILALLIVTLGVLAAFGAFFFSLARRASRTSRSEAARRSTAMAAHIPGGAAR